MTHAQRKPRRAALAVFAAALLLILALPGLAAAHGRGHDDRGHGGHHGKPQHPPKGHGHGHGHGNGPGHGHGHGHGDVVNTMTRNLYLGADLAPAIGAPSLDAFVAATGQILREVSANDFPTRAKGLAQEILTEKPDLVGLQEVALWRTGPPSLAPVLSGEPSATTVRYDYLQLLLDQLNKGPDRYEVVAVQNEFDLEAPGDENGVPGDGPAEQGIPNAEINGRLTMRDVILARRGAGVQTANTQSGNFKVLLPVPILGQPLIVKRGWTATDAKVRGSGWFRFVNTHLEAFDPAALVPSIRSLQAGELVAPGGPATGTLPVDPGRRSQLGRRHGRTGRPAGLRVLLEAGFVERSTAEPLGCCLRSSLLAEGAGGSVADFDHQVDHVMTNDPDEITLKIRRSPAYCRSMASGTPITRGCSAPCASTTEAARGGRSDPLPSSWSFAQPSPAVAATNSATSLVCSSLRMPPGIRPGVVELLTPVFDRVEDAAFGRFDRVRRGRAARRPGRSEQFVEIGPVVAVGSRRVERVAGAAVGLEQRLAALQVRGDLLVPGLGVALGAECQPGDDHCEKQDQQSEDDEGALAH